MTSLARYAVANAVTRTMLSELLTVEDFDSIIRSASVEEAWLALRKTSYGRWLPESVVTEELAIEKILRESTAYRYQRAARILKGKPGEVGKLLLSRWDLDNLEFALRLWHGQDSTLDEFLTYPSFVHDIPIYDITAAGNIDEIALALRNTPYFDPVIGSSKGYKEKGSIFCVEVALETDHYRRLLDGVRALGGRDTLEAEKIVASEIDLINLAWLARLVHYYDVRPSEVHEFMIPGPSAISKRLASPGETADILDVATSELLAASAGGVDKGAPDLEKISFLEHMVNDMAVGVARKLLAGYPFRITCVISFYLLKRVELKNLCTVFVAKAGGLSESEISGRLCGLG